MAFQVTVKDLNGRTLSMTDLKKYVISKEDYYHRTGEIDKRIKSRMDLPKKCYNHDETGKPCAAVSVFFQ